MFQKLAPSLGIKIERERESKRLRRFVKYLFSFLFAASLFFTVHSSVYAATIYVDSINGNDTWDGSGFAHPSGTIGPKQTFSTAFTAASAGDTIELSGGTSGQSYIQHTSSINKANLTIQGSSLAGYNGTVILDSNPSTANTSYTIGLNADNITVKNITILRSYANVSSNLVNIYKHNDSLINVIVNATASANMNVPIAVIATTGDSNSLFQNVVVNNSANLIEGILLTQNSGTATFNNVTINNIAANNGNGAVYLYTGVTANLNNCIITFNIGTPIYFNNGGTVNTNHCIIQGSVTSPQSFTSGASGTWNSTGDTLNGFPYFTRTKRNLGYILLSTDDRGNIGYFQSIAALANGYGLPMSMYVNETYMLTASDKTALQTLYKAGNEIGVHTRHHTNLSETNPIKITYSGAGTSMTVAISGSGTSLSVTGTADTHGPIDLMSAPNNTVGGLCTTISSWTNYSCALNSGTTASTILSNSLKDTSTALPQNVATGIPYDDDTSANNRLYKEEITNSVNDLESALHEDAGCSSYQAKTLAFPGNVASTQALNWVKNNTNLTAVRSNSDQSSASRYDLSQINLLNAQFYYGLATVQGSGYSGLSTSDKEARIRQSARIMATWASQGNLVGMLNHNTSTGLTVQEFGWLIDELAKYTSYSQINTLAYFANQIRTSGNWTYNGGTGLWERTFTGADDFRLTSSSPAINTGVTVSGRTSDILGNSLVGIPDIGVYEFQAPSAPTSLAQYKSDGTTAISSGGYTPQTSVVLKFSMSSVNTSDSLTPQIEVQPVGTVFTGTQTNSGTAVAYSGTPVTGTVTVTGLTAGTSYHWQARASNAASTGSWTTTGNSTDFIIDTTAPTSPSLSSPTGYTKDNTKPTLVFKKSTDSGSGVATYSVSLDSGKNRSFSTSGIPSSGNGSSDYVWKDDSSVKVEFLNENDSDSSNDEIHVYFKDLDKQDLSEGKHAWTVTAYDSVGNSTSSSADFYLDKTNPSISELAIANVSTVLSGVSYNLDITNRMPSFSGLAYDNYQGSTDVSNTNGTKDSFDKVSSGPQTLTLTFKKQKDDKTYADYLSKDYSLTNIQDANGDKKSSRFYVTTSSPLVDGEYQTTLTPKDNAGNTYSYPNFYISINAGVSNPIQNLLTGNLETKVTNQETVPAVTQDEKQQVQENGYTVKIKVVDTNNKPVSGAKVTIHSKIQTATTDQNGIAQFNNVEQGKHTVNIAYSGYQGQQIVNLTGEVNEFDLNVQVKPQSAFLNPQVIGVIGMLVVVIGVMSFMLIKAKRKELG